MAKRIDFHPEDLRALEQLADDKSSTLQELMDEAVRDLLKKHGRPTNLKDALRQSANPPASNSKGRKRRARLPR